MEMPILTSGGTCQQASEQASPSPSEQYPFSPSRQSPPSVLVKYNKKPGCQKLPTASEPSAMTSALLVGVMV